VGSRMVAQSTIGGRLRITTSGSGGDGTVRVQTYGEVIEANHSHEEAKGVGSDGQPCGKKTRGLLRGRKVSMLGLSKARRERVEQAGERMRDQLPNEAAFLSNYDGRTFALWM
jgi:hypothetical protein